MTTSWTKNQLVISFSDYDNTWSVKTKPLTLNQAIKFVIYVTKGHVFQKITRLLAWQSGKQCKKKQQPHKSTRGLVPYFKENQMKSKIIQTLVEYVLAIVIFGGIGVLLAWRG